MIYNIAMNTTKILEKYGLNQKEAKVYLACLELGKASIQEIALNSGLKRPTVYLIIDILQEKGFISKYPEAKKTLFIAENPDILLKLLKEKESNLKNILPQLKAIYKTSSENKPIIKFFEGREGVARLYKEEFWQAKQYILFYGSIKDISENFPDEFLNINEIAKMNIPVKEIVSANPVDIEYGRKINKHPNIKHQARMAGENIIFNMDCAIFDDKISIVSVKKNFFGVLIQSQDISNSFKILYDLAWQSAKQII